MPLSAAVRHRQVGLGQVLGGVEVPVGGDLADDLGLFVTGQRGLVLEGHGFAGVLDHEGAVGDLGLDLLPGALEEDEGVVVGGRAGIEIQRVALGGAGLLDQVLAPGRAHGHAVKGHIVVDRIGVADQAVVGDDLDARGFRFFGGRGGRRGILRGDDQHLDALADQRFDVRLFLGAVTLAEQRRRSRPSRRPPGLAASAAHPSSAARRPPPPCPPARRWLPGR